MFSFFREIGQRSSEELAREGSGVKAFASFISELGALVPELMLPNISVVIPHLEGEVFNINSFIIYISHKHTYLKGSLGLCCS